MKANIEHQVHMSAVGRGSVFSKDGKTPAIDFVHVVEERKDVFICKQGGDAVDRTSFDRTSSSSRHQQSAEVVLSRDLQHHIYFKNPLNNRIDCLSFDDFLPEGDSDEDYESDIYDVFDEDDDDEEEDEVIFPVYRKEVASSSSRRGPSEEEIAAAKKAEAELLEMLAKEEAAEVAKRKPSKSSPSSSASTPQKKKKKKSSNSKDKHKKK